MPITIKDSDNISEIHTAERLQINLASANEDVEQMYIEVFFTIETKLPSGRTVGYPYWDNQPVVINCKGNSELTKAMKIIQESVGKARYLQLTAPPIVDLEIPVPEE